MSERDMRRLMKLVAKHLGAEWVDVSEWLRTLPDNDLEAIEARLLLGQSAIAELDQAALRFAAETHGQYVRAAETTSRWMDGKIADRLIRFDSADDSVVRRARRNQIERVYGFRDESQQIARQITQRALVEGAGTGINPRRMAVDFRNSIGLAPIQEEWVANYQRALEEGRYADAMRRELHDDRSNRMLARIKRDNEALSEAQIGKLVERYRKNMVAYRAETVARTESGANVEAGVKDSIEQAISRGDVDVEQLEKEWHSRNASDRAREQHQAMDGVRVGFREDFVLPDGTRMSGPHDPRGGAEHNANCGCTSSTTLAA